MPRKRYRCSLFMGHAQGLAQEWIDGDAALLDAVDAGEKLMEALYKDQHDLYHDDEFTDGCDICDEERREYG